MGAVAAKPLSREDFLFKAFLRCNGDRSVSAPFGASQAGEFAGLGVLPIALRGQR